MPARLSTSFVNTVVPGPYPEVIVQSNPVGVAASGVIAIIGEADGGDHFSAEDLKNNFFGPTQIDAVTQKYVSGNIVDAMRMLASPSADADITGAPTRVLILKTNVSSTASSALAASYGTVSAKVSGLDGNKYKYEITQIDDEIAPEVSGDTIANFAALAGVEFNVRLNGGAEVSIDVFTGAPGDYDTISEVVALIDAALPAGMSCVAGDAADSVKILVDADALAHQKGWGKSFELIEVTAGGLTALGLDEGLYTSAVEPRTQIEVKRSDINLNESFTANANIAMTLGYEGTTATVTITPSTLTTSVTGGAGGNLLVNLADYTTIGNLVDFINSQPGYSAQAQVGSVTLPPSTLDQVAAIGICSSSDEQAGRIKKTVHNVNQAFAQSRAVEIEIDAVAGLPNETATAVFLSGGAKGSTTAASIVNAIDALEGLNVNFVVPLFSRDASEDIADGLTESSSTYTISAVNAAVRNHCLKMSTTRVKKHRSAYVSFWGTYNQAKAEASAVSHYRMTVAFQQVSQVDAFGEIRIYMPWMAAVNAAGMQAAGFYKSIMNKSANVISFVNPEGYDSENIDSQEDSLSAGLLPLVQDIGANKWLADYTSHLTDGNFVYTSSQLVYVSDLLTLDFSASIHRAFTGKSLADADASTIIGFAVSKADQYKRQKLIIYSDDAPQGFKNLKVNIRGAITEISIEFKPSEKIIFEPITITLSQSTQSAEA